MAQKAIVSGAPLHKPTGFVHELRKNWILFAMLIPVFAYFIINNYLPLVGIYYAFTRFNFRGGLFGSPFIGMDNFKFLFQNGTLYNITKNTVLYNIVFIALGNGLQVFTAILISKMFGSRFKKTAQSIMFLPYFVSYVILSVFAYNVFNYEYGFLNTFLRSIGAQPFDVYSSASTFPFIIVFFYLWKNIGYGTVIYLAAMLGINTEIYEAADIDGANIFQQIRYITLPLIKPTFIILLLYSVGGILKGQFDLFYQLVGNNGLLFSTTDIIDTYVYRSLMTSFNVGMSTAAGLYQSVFGFLLILTVNFFVKRTNPEYALF